MNHHFSIITKRTHPAMRRFFYLLSVVCAVSLSGCAARQEAAQEPLMPIPETSVFKDPGDARFMRAIAEYIGARNGPASTRYEFTRVDLDNDGRREGIVMLKTPHAHWCSAEGCLMAVFKANNDSFTLISEIAPVRGPLTVSSHATNGWRDLMLRISGRMDRKTKDVALRFDGRAYPARPEMQPPILCAWNDVDGVRIFP